MPTRLAATAIRQMRSSRDMARITRRQDWLSPTTTANNCQPINWMKPVFKLARAKNDNRNASRLDRDSLLGHLLLVDVPSFLKAGNHVEGIARRDEADREAVEGRTRSHPGSASQGAGDQGIGEGRVGQGFVAERLSGVSHANRAARR